jgi:surface protein
MAVSLALPVVDSRGPLLFYLIHFTSYFSSSFSTNTTAFSNTHSFNGNISQWDVSSVTNMGNSTSFLANC